MSCYCIEITDDPNLYEPGLLSPSDIYEDTRKTAVDDTEYTDPDKKLQLFNDLIPHLETGIEAGIPWMSWDEAAKKKYFRMVFDQFKIHTNICSLNEFIDNPYSIIRYISDEYGTQVSFNSCIESLDMFLREMQPDTKYYIGNILIIN